MKLSTSTKVKNFLNSTDANFNADAQIETISSIILGMTNRLSFSRGQFTQNSIDGEVITLKALPVVSIDEVKDDEGNVLVSDFGYKANKGAGVVRFVEDDKEYSVKYTGGYLVDFANENDITKHTLPEDLVGLITSLSASLYTKIQNGEMNEKIIASESVEGQSVSYFNDALKNSKNVILGITLSDFQMSVLEKYSLNDFI